MYKKGLAHIYGFTVYFNGVAPAAATTAGGEVLGLDCIAATGCFVCIAGLC